MPFFPYQNGDAFLSFTNLISPFSFSTVCSSEDWCGKQCRHTALIRKLFMWKFMITSLLQLALQKSEWDSRVVFSSSFYELNFMSPHLRKTGFSARCKQEMLTLRLRLQLNTNYHLPLCALLPNDCKFRGKMYFSKCGEKQNEIFDQTCMKENPLLQDYVLCMCQRNKNAINRMTKHIFTLFGN